MADFKMDKLTALGLACTLIGGVIAVASQVISEKKTQQQIDEKIEEGFAKRFEN